MNIISPIDGRYSKDTEIIKEHFTEYQLIKNRYIIELEYLIYLLKYNFKEFPYNVSLENYLYKLIYDFDKDELYRNVKEIEKEINHDVKSVEYYIGKLLKNKGYDKYINLIHFGLTSQDINTTAYSYSLKNFNNNLVEIIEKNIVKKLENKILEWNDDIIIGRTHGQPATWTKLDKEIKVFITRIKYELKKLKKYNFTTKFGGSIGNLTSHYILSKDIDWNNSINSFCKESFGLYREEYTTQIHNYNNYSEYFDIIKRLSCTLKDLCIDMWLYISNKNIILEKPKKHVGSSIMPHKVNPIEFENAEGNLEIVIMWCNFISSKLLTSRLQRDLTDSTILRNIGVIFGHLLISLNKISKGITYIKPNKEFNDEQLEKHLYCMSEIENHILRIENNQNGYNSIKEKGIITKTLEEYKKYLF